VVILVIPNVNVAAFVKGFVALIECIGHEIYLPEETDPQYYWRKTRKHLLLPPRYNQVKNGKIEPYDPSSCKSLRLYIPLSPANLGT
jgi:hypothetical protein